MLLIFYEGVEVLDLLLRLECIYDDSVFRDIHIIMDDSLEILLDSHSHNVASGTELLSDTVSFVGLNVWDLAEGYASSEYLTVVDDILDNGVEVFVLAFELLVEVKTSPSVDSSDETFRIPSVDINLRPHVMK